MSVIYCQRGNHYVDTDFASDFITYIGRSKTGSLLFEDVCGGCMTEDECLSYEEGLDIIDLTKKIPDEAFWVKDKSR